MHRMLALTLRKLIDHTSQESWMLVFKKEKNKILASLDQRLMTNTSSTPTLSPRLLKQSEEESLARLDVSLTQKK